MINHCLRCALKVGYTEGSLIGINNLRWTASRHWRLWLFLNVFRVPIPIISQSLSIYFRWLVLASIVCFKKSSTHFVLPVVISSAPDWPRYLPTTEEEGLFYISLYNVLYVYIWYHTALTSPVDRRQGLKQSQTMLTTVYLLYGKNVNCCGNWWTSTVV